MPHTYALHEIDPLIEMPVSPFAARHGHFSPCASAGPSAGGAPPAGLTPGGGSAHGRSAGGGGYAGSDGGAVAALVSGAAATLREHEAESTHATLGSVLGSGPSSGSLGGASAPGTAGGAPPSVSSGGCLGNGGGLSAGGATDDGFAALAYSGSFFNYFSIGGDAQAAHGFHSLRERRPGWAGSRMANMFWYSWYSCSSGESAAVAACFGVGWWEREEGRTQVPQLLHHKNRPIQHASPPPPPTHPTHPKNSPHPPPRLVLQHHPLDQQVLQRRGPQKRRVGPVGGPPLRQGAGGGEPAVVRRRAQHLGRADGAGEGQAAGVRPAVGGRRDDRGGRMQMRVRVVLIT
jgi:hypothetical protein